MRVIHTISSMGCPIMNRPWPYPTDVICLEGGGFTSVEGEEGQLRAGYSIRWSADSTRRLWTETETMTVLMVEHFRQR